MSEQALDLQAVGAVPALDLQPVADHEAIIRKAYSDAGVSPDLGVAIALHEGRGTLRPEAVNNTGGDAARGGSYGASQVSLQTARELGFKGTPQELLDPATNARYAAA